MYEVTRCYRSVFGRLVGMTSGCIFQALLSLVTCKRDILLISMIHGFQVLFCSRLINSPSVSCPYESDMEAIYKHKSGTWKPFINIRAGAADAGLGATLSLRNLSCCPEGNLILKRDTP